MDLDRLAQPLLEAPTGASLTRARQLTVDRCDIRHARVLIARWHSRLPDTQTGPWMAAYRAAHDGITYAVALWNSPSARTLPSDWMELRRMAVAEDAPHCTASRFLNEMCRRIQAEFPAVTRVISYQDRDVHTGTIYKAVGWTVGNISDARVRDRSGKRAGTDRMYRWNLNGAAPDAAGKVRWEKPLGKATHKEEPHDVLRDVREVPAAGAVTADPRVPRDGVRGAASSGRREPHPQP